LEAEQSDSHLISIIEAGDMITPAAEPCILMGWIKQLSTILKSFLASYCVSESSQRTERRLKKKLLLK
jgi:hypothetical protein